MGIFLSQEEQGIPPSEQGIGAGNSDIAFTSLRTVFPG
jgi:hypothetical protein